MENSSPRSMEVARKILILTISSVAIASYFNNAYCSAATYQDDDNYYMLAASIKQACNNTTHLRHLLQISLSETTSLVLAVQPHFSNLSHHQHLSTQNKNAFRDCSELLDLTLDELELAMDHIGGYTSQAYHSLKTLLSAAMTNENTCTDRFLKGHSRNQKMLKESVHKMVDPISTMISNCLAMISCMEGRDKAAGPHDTWIASGERNLMEATAEISPNVTVASDGSGDHRWISEAVRMAPDKSTSRYVIHIKAGLYEEGVRITREKTNIMFVGDGMNSTLITGSRSVADGFTTFNSATLSMSSRFISCVIRFTAMSLSCFSTHVSSCDRGQVLGKGSHRGQYSRSTEAPGCCSKSDIQRSILSLQFHIISGYSIFDRECTIQGTIDFIFGNAAAVFQNCRILVRKPMLGQKNMITAQGRNDPNQNTGIIIQNCVISVASGFTLPDMKYYPTFLGRPWRNFSRTIVMKSYLGHMIHPQGWCLWNQYSNLDTVEYIEHMNFGPGSNTTQRIRWGGFRNNCSDEMVKPFTVGEFLLGVDGWFETIGFPLSQGT